jgi:hypothetical protein
MSELIYKVGELKQIIKESSTEFKPVLGTNVERDNKTNNEKSYKESEKRAKDFDGGLKKQTKKKPAERNDYNGSMLDLDTVEGLDDATKQRIQDQAAGWTSTKEKNNKIEKDDSLEYNDDFYQDRKKTKKVKDKKEKEIKYSGLTSHRFEPVKNNLYKEGKLKTLHYKHTEFLNEEHMKTRIPDDFKCEGVKFNMEDKVGNVYLVEWTDNNARVVNFHNKRQVNEEMNRIKNLFNYNSSSHVTTSTSNTRLNENNSFNDVLDSARRIIK